MNIDDNNCKTTPFKDDSPAHSRGKPCIFPFKAYIDKEKRTFHGCTMELCGENCSRYWCSTKVDDNGIHISGGGNWGYCNTKCSNDEDLNPKTPITISTTQKPINCFGRGIWRNALISWCNLNCRKGNCPLSSCICN